jgi:hypothetical protein
VLSISEDAWANGDGTSDANGDAAFTVSVDGKQLAGTFYATALNAAGSSQSFSFKGDWASGNHTVAVNFLNDAWGGTPSTDRNLYVKDVTYDRTDTKQSFALMSKGSHNFSVADTTAVPTTAGGSNPTATPMVSETSDHGSLQENLSQTGTYTVGGDTFVLSSGNVVSVTLGTGVSQINFIGASSVTLTGGSGQATVSATMGNNNFVAGSGSLDVTGGAGKDAYVFHANSGLLTLEDFSLAKGDTLTIDKSLQGSLHEASDGIGGTMLTFGTGHSVDMRGVASLPSSNIAWA